MWFDFVLMLHTDLVTYVGDFLAAVPMSTMVLYGWALMMMIVVKTTTTFSHIQFEYLLHSDDNRHFLDALLSQSQANPSFI